MNTHPTFDVITIPTPSLGDRTYIATDGEVAVVVDAQRDIDRVLDVVAERGLRITHVLETHVHNDYVTGGFALARQTGAAYLLAADDAVEFERVAVRDGDAFSTGRLRIRPIHTPGHTFTHMSYAVEFSGSVRAVFSGGSLLFGSTGRPDLLGDDHTGTLVRLQHASARRLAAALPPQAALFPTHGFGSFCSSSQSDATASTLARESEANPALTLDLHDFVEATLAGLDAYPAYYAHMAPANRGGPDAADLRPVHRADAAELRRRIEAGEWVVDLRTRSAFAVGHVAGTLNFGRDGSFVTYLGWLIDWGTPVTLLADTPEEVAEAQRDMARIGIDRPAAAATGSLRDWLGAQAPARYPTASFRDLATSVHAARDGAVLDVRRSDEWRASHIAGALHIPIHELPGRIGEVPTERPVWVHCATGYRAAIAASLLDRAGRTVVLVDDEFDTAADKGVALARETAAA